MNHAPLDAADPHGPAPAYYQRYFVPAIGAPLAEDLLDAASLRPGERVLDVACGTGVVTRLAAERVGAQGMVAGLDVNPGMLAVARSVTPPELGVAWYETSAEAMPLGDASFDVVLCQMGLQFVADRPRAVSEVRRVVRPDGRVVLGLPGPTPAPFVQLGQALGRHIDPHCAGFVHAVFSLHDEAVLRGLVSDAGFRQVEVHRSSRTLRLPGPQDFLWQYIGSTPLGERVGQASESARRALQDDVTARWREHVVGDHMRIEVEITTVVGA